MPSKRKPLMSNDERFARGLTYLKAYKAAHGDCDFRQLYRAPDGFPLGVWLTLQRQKWQAGNLPAERVTALVEVGVDLSPRGTQFKSALDRLKRYKAAFGHTSVPANYVCKDGYSLGQWLSNQCRAYRAGTLSEERRIALGNVGCDLDYRDKGKTNFEKGLAALVAFGKRNGHYDVDPSHVQSGFALGSWLRAVRDRISRSEAPEYEIDAFREHGISFPAPGSAKPRRTHEQAFAEAIGRIQAFKETYGHVRVPFDYVCKDGYKLGQWLTNCRRHWRKGNVRPDRVLALESLGISPIMPDYRHDASISHLVHPENGSGSPRAQPPQGASNTEPTVPFIRSGAREAWERAFVAALDHLSEYKEAFGHVDVRVSYVCEDGFKLGQWLAQCRHQWRHGQLRQKRVSALEAIGVSSPAQTGAARTKATPHKAKTSAVAVSY